MQQLSTSSPNLLFSAINIMGPFTNCSTLELISPDLWITLDGCVIRLSLTTCTHILISYEFATNEFINDMCSVPLETSSTESGTKDFIVVGTTIDRGEDLATKGAVSLQNLCQYSILTSNERPTSSRSLKSFQTRTSLLSGGTSFVSAAEMKPKDQ